MYLCVAHYALKLFNRVPKKFKRVSSLYSFQVYIPSSLIVVMSWVSFWLNRGAAPARVGLGVTTVLTMTTLINSVNAALPKISYMKSIDIYLFVCFFMVFGALIEYACVGYTDKRINLRKKVFEVWHSFIIIIIAYKART